MSRRKRRMEEPLGAPPRGAARQTIRASGYSQHGASRTNPTTAAWRAISKSPAEDITENLELLLFTIIELISSTATNCILYSTPVSLDEYLPYLHRAIHYLIAGFTSEGGEAQ